MICVWYKSTGSTALMLAAASGHTDTVNALINAGAEIEATAKR